MSNTAYNFGAIIPLAWPDSLVNTSFKLMDPIFNILNLSQKGFYKVGHAAMLVVHNDGSLYYFDFGRYISPKGKGRIRGANTDPEVQLKSKAIWQNNQLLNFEDILLDLAVNPHTHGEGTMYAGIHYIPDVNKALQYIYNQQKREFISYGPYVPNGTNCSRFVAQTIAKVSSFSNKFKFLFPIYTTPSPLGNIFNSNGQLLMEVCPPDLKQIPIETFNQKITVLKNKVILKPNDPLLQNVDFNNRYQFNAPQRNPLISEEAQWLGGMGAGAWFTITEIIKNLIKVKRQQKNGFVDYESYFKLQHGDFNPTQSYKFVYGSNFEKTVLLQNNQKSLFIRLS